MITRLQFAAVRFLFAALSLLERYRHALQWLACACAAAAMGMVDWPTRLLVFASFLGAGAAGLFEGYAWRDQEVDRLQRDLAVARADAASARHELRRLEREREVPTLRPPRLRVRGGLN